MNLATRIKARRIELGFTQRYVAESLDMSQQSLQRIESGQVSNPRKIIKLAEVLKCEPDWLLFGQLMKFTTLMQITTPARLNAQREHSC